MTQPLATRFPTPALDKLPDDIRTRILAVQEKSGFVPNVFLTLAYRPDEFRAFFAYHDALMEKDGGLTKAEREMIVVATSSANQCHYCVIAHGAILRIRAKNPLIADQIAVNYRKADITPRQRAMLDFAMKVSRAANEIAEADFADCGQPRVQRRGHLGHRRDRGLLCAVEPPGQRHRDAPERRVLHDGAAAEMRLRQLSRPTPVRTSRADRSRPCCAPTPGPSPSPWQNWPLRSCAECAGAGDPPTGIR